MVEEKTEAFVTSSEWVPLALYSPASGRSYLREYVKRADLMAQRQKLLMESLDEKPAGAHGRGRESLRWGTQLLHAAAAVGTGLGSAFDLTQKSLTAESQWFSAGMQLLVLPGDANGPAGCFLTSEEAALRAEVLEDEVRAGKLYARVAAQLARFVSDHLLLLARPLSDEEILSIQRQVRAAHSLGFNLESLPDLPEDIERRLRAAGRPSAKLRTLRAG